MTCPQPSGRWRRCCQVRYSRRSIPQSEAAAADDCFSVCLSLVGSFGAGAAMRCPYDGSSEQEEVLMQERFPIRARLS